MHVCDHCKEELNRRVTYITDKYFDREDTAYVREFCNLTCLTKWVIKNKKELITGHSCDRP